MKALEKEMASYLKEQKEHFGCEVKYWGTGKNRFQLEVPVAKVKKLDKTIKQDLKQLFEQNFKKIFEQDLKQIQR